MKPRCPGAGDAADQNGVAPNDPVSTDIKVACHNLTAAPSRQPAQWEVVSGSRRHRLDARGIQLDIEWKDEASIEATRHFVFQAVLETLG